MLQVEKKIRSRVKRQMEKTQREYYLNEQLKAIQRELGNEEGEGGDELAELAAKIRKTRLSKEARARANAELKKLKAHGADVGRGDGRAQLSRRAARPAVGQEVAAEAATSPRPSAVLDEDHYGLEKVKDRIVEYLAVQARTNKLEGADPVPRRPAGRRQDLVGPLDRPRDGPRVRAPVAGRRARRSRDPRPPPHLHRLAAGQDHRQSEEGGDVEPVVPARRDRQARHRFPRRSGLGPAGGARPRAEQPLPGPLSGARL